MDRAWCQRGMMTEVDTEVLEPEDKDFVLFVDKSGKFSGNYDVSSIDQGQTDVHQSAINEDTGEINWDCPCLKSALAPPCGEFFREAFSCFVISRTEPKGSDCLDKFSAMQDCFRAHPEIYMREGGEDELDTSGKASMNIDGTQADTDTREYQTNTNLPTTGN